MFSKKALFICATALSAQVAVSDVVVFKSGARLTGTVESIVGGEISFKSDDVGVVKIAQAKVESLVTDKPNTIQYNDKSTEQGVLSMTNGVYALSGKTLDMGNVKAVNPVVETWHGSITLSGTAQRGNTVGESATVLADLNRRWEKDRLTTSLGYYFAQSGSSNENKEKTEDRIVLKAQEDHFWSAKFYTYVNGMFERDGMNDLDRRFRVGAGTGYQWLDGQVFESTGKWSFNQELGAEYVSESWANKIEDAEMDYAAFRYAHHLTWAPRWCPSISVFHNLEYHPDVTDWSETYIINADVGFTAPIYAGWQVTGKIQWDYNSNPADTAKSSDFRYILGLGYKW